MKNNVKSFEFGVSLGQIEFVQNWDLVVSEELCVGILEKLMDTNKFEIEEKTYGTVIFDYKDNLYSVMTRPYVEDWEWDFDHPDTIEFEISL
jgi:hypothetical protein